MRFFFSFSNSNYVGKLLYIKEEKSLCFDPFCKSTNVSIMISGAYSSLDTILKNGEIIGEVIHVSGCNPQHIWVNRTLHVPEVKKGRLFVQFDKPIMGGTGIDYANDWQTYYDKNNNWICIGDYNTTEDCELIEFASNIIAALKNEKLIAIWAKIEIEK